jgi:hypothetical protein
LTECCDFRKITLGRAAWSIDFLLP